MTEKQECLLKPGLVILVEGHYTLRTEFNNLIDYNILMLGDAKELLARKIARVEGYRKAKEAEDYFGQVDLPSFCHHLERFGFNADLILDNTDYQHSKIESHPFLDQWLSQNESSKKGVEQNMPLMDLSDLSNRVLSVSMMANADLKSALEGAFECLMEWDRYVGKCLRVHVENISEDLTSFSETLLASLKEKFSGKPYTFSVRHTNTLWNVYHRRLPITIGLSIEGGPSVSMLADVFHDFLRIQIVWAGGYTRFHVERRLGDISNQNKYVLKEIKPQRSDNFRVITPTPFIVPSFLRDFEAKFVFSGHEDENISASQALMELFDKGGVWIHRFAKFSEMNFFCDIVMNAGGNAVKAGNYLIAVLSKNQKLCRAFKLFRQEWHHRLSDFSCNAQDEVLLDNIIDQERQELDRFVKNNCPDFSVMDGYLHCSKAGGDVQAWDRIVPQIAAMLSGSCRLVRKRGMEFIQKYFPELSLEASKIWEDLPPGAKKHISLDALTSLSPTILAEIYLWLALRDDHSAVLGANIYDIRKNSLDCSAYLEAAAQAGTALVLQGSLNALGQKEEENGTVMQGYLKPKAGAQDLVEAALQSARDLLLVSGKVPPLFGIGLDHVDAANDKPKGRASRFLENAMATECVTHYVLDGSSLFKAQHHSKEELSESFNDISEFAVGLLGKKNSAYIYDKEICCGELQYFGASQKALIPTASDLEHFADIFKNNMRKAGLGALNTRPTLFVGNLGTTHHGEDTGEVAVEKAKEWRDKLKKTNFISAVLHGTTGSHPNLLSKAAGGCHKINVAGDFLNTLVKALPKRLQSVVCSDNKEDKRKMPEIREGMDAMSSSEIAHAKESLKSRCRSVLDNINSPKLNALDAKYFRYKNFKFSSKQVQVICDALLKQVKCYDQMESKKYADPSMGCAFSASMIEVPFDEKYKQL
ncbi:MAG: class II fructose-bisphosphate aldolase, partial [Deltaproteobacteria bacterium]|nr:class II fructose-bisphosphate aldolase [Deltaproteobacteria bacterium]